MRRRRALRAGAGLVLGAVAGCVREFGRFETYRYETAAPINGDVAIPWRTLGFDAQRTGYTPFGRLPQNIAVDPFVSARHSIHTQPAYIDGTAYFDARQVNPSSLGWETGLGAFDGRKKRWFVAQPNPLATPTVVGDAVFVTSTGLTTALNRHDGTLCWAYHAGRSNPTASPTVIDETAYVVGERVVALDAATGEIKWATNRPAGTLRGTAATTNAVFATAGDGDRGTVFRFDPDTGQESWRRSLPTNIRVAPVIGHFVYVVGTDGRLRSLDPASGDIEWAQALDNPAPTMPAVGKRTIFAVARRGSRLFAFNAITGDMRWTFPFNADRAVAPTVAGDSVYLPLGDPGGGVLYELSPRNGRLRGFTNLPQAPRSPLVVGTGTGLISAGGRESTTTLYRLHELDD